MTKVVAKARSILLVAGVLGWLALPAGSVGALAQEPQAWAFEFHHDFRGRPLPPELAWFNPGGGKFYHEEAEGARIAIPSTWIHPPGGVGFRTTFGFGGDFEVTVAFEILEAETPPTGYGVGISLHVAKPGGGASLYRLKRKGGRELLLWERAQAVAENQKPRAIEGMRPCRDKSGRLRLERVGSTLRYLWAAGTAEGEFEELHQLEFGDGPIDRVRVAGLTGRQACTLDLRLLDLRIRSRTSDRPAAAPEVPGAARRSGWRVALVSVLVLTTAVAIWLAARRSRREPRAD